jgi:4-diphosphocytidyl-2-C-methyl-D-erythritol kinase
VSAQAAAVPPLALRARVAAKVNLALLVGARRADGYHEIRSVLQSVSLWDRLDVLPAADGLSLEVEGGPLPADEGNLVLVAAREADRRRAGGGGGARFLLRKGIPVAAGLGGGSADGAAALLALDRLWDLGLAAGDLAVMAAEVGSDVPFCLTGGTSLAGGRGEQLQAVPAAGTFWWVVGIAREWLATATVYRRYDELGPPRPLVASGLDALLDALASGAPERLAPELVNDLEAAAFRLLPGLAMAKQRLLDAGALGAVMSGSGPTLLALCASREHARAVASSAAPAFHRVRVAHSPVPGVTLETQEEETPEETPGVP